MTEILGKGSEPFRPPSPAQRASEPVIKVGPAIVGRIPEEPPARAVGVASVDSGSFSLPPQRYTDIFPRVVVRDVPKGEKPRENVGDRREKRWKRVLIAGVALIAGSLGGLIGVKAAEHQHNQDSRPGYVQQKDTSNEQNADVQTASVRGESQS